MAKLRRVWTAASIGIALTFAPVRAFNDGVSISPTIQTAAYSPGYAIGGLLTVPFFRNAALKPSGVLNLVQLWSKAGATNPITLYIFDTQPSSPCQDHSSFALASADEGLVAVPPLTLTPGSTTGTTATSASLLQAMSVANQDVPAGRVLYVCMVVGSPGFTPASTNDLVLKISGALD